MSHQKLLEGNFIFACGDNSICPQRKTSVQIASGDVLIRLRRFNDNPKATTCCLLFQAEQWIHSLNRHTDYFPYLSYIEVGKKHEIMPPIIFHGNLFFFGSVITCLAIGFVKILANRDPDSRFVFEVNIKAL